MKSILLLAFLVAFALANVTIFPIAVTTPPGVKTAQPIFVQNNAAYSAGAIITNVTVEVFVIPLPGSNGVATVDYYNPNPYYNTTPNMNLITGVYLGAIASGVVNGTANWYLTATVGSYGAIYYCRYIQSGKTYSSYNYSIITISNSGKRETQDELTYTPHTSVGRYVARDGSNTDISCAYPGGCTEFQGENGVPTWNRFSWITNTTSVYLVSYSAVCNDSNVAIAPYTANATQNATAHSGGIVMFTISGRSGSYALRFTLKYAHLTPKNGPTNYTWISAWYPFYISDPPSGNGTPVRRSDEEMKKDFDAYIAHSAKVSKFVSQDPQTVSVQFAFGAGAAVAAAAIVAIVAIVAAVARSKKQSNTTGNA